MENKYICAHCQRELDVGVDVIRIDEGVMGMKDFVPLDNTLYFCCEDCVRDYFDLSNLPNIPGRFP